MNTPNPGLLLSGHMELPNRAAGVVAIGSVVVAIILDRYVAYKQSGQKGRPLDDVIQEIRVANGL